MKGLSARGHWAWVALLVLGAVAPCTWAGQNYENVIIGDAPVGYWRLSESATTPVAAEISGFSTTPQNGIYSRGAIAGGPSFIKNDPTTSTTFDGLTAYVDVLDLGQATSPQTSYGQTLTAGFSVEAWVSYLGSIESTAANRIVSTRFLPTNPNGGWGFGVNSTTNQLRFTTFGIEDYDATTNPMSVIPTDGSMHYLAVVFDPVALPNGMPGATFYVDGVPTETVAGTVAAFPSPMGLQIGRNPLPDGSNLSEFWNGNIQDVAIYNYDMTDAQVLAHYNAGIATP